MAPGVPVVQNDIEAQLKDIVQNLYNLIVQGYDHRGPATEDAMKRETVSLAQNLVRLSQEAPNVKVRVPPELISYVESARNPDVFTREFVEAVQRMNQGLKGRCEAYLYLRNTLAKDIIAAMPELKDDVARVVATTGDTLTTD